MTTIILGFVGFVLVMAMMAIGVMIKGRRIAGSCGGLANLKDGEKCGFCGATAPSRHPEGRSPEGTRANHPDPCDEILRPRSGDSG